MEDFTKESVPIHVILVRGRSVIEARIVGDIVRIRRFRRTFIVQVSDLGYRECGCAKGCRSWNKCLIIPQKGVKCFIVNVSDCEMEDISPIEVIAFAPEYLSTGRDSPD